MRNRGHFQSLHSMHPRRLVALAVVILLIAAASCTGRPASSTAGGAGETPAATATSAAAAQGGAAAQSQPRPAESPSAGSPSTGKTSAGEFDGPAAYKHALAQCNIGPRDAGTEGDRKTADYITTQLKQFGWQVQTQDFQFQGVPIRNVIGIHGQGPVVIIGAHFDSRKYADQDPKNPTAPVPAGNDGASGVAVLLELARVWSKADLGRTVWLAFFDAEDNGDIDGWPWSVGARHMAESLTTPPEFVIVIDMIGDADQQIYMERTGDKELQQELWKIAADLGYAKQFIPVGKWIMTDDHTPFLERGFRAIDMIDFDYPYWHTTQDTCDKVSPDSLERVGRVLDHFMRAGP